MHIGPGYVKDIEDWPRPKNKKEVERFPVFSNECCFGAVLRFDFHLPIC
jgi:hypothetical protein